VDGPGGGFFPFQKSDNLLPPPHCSVVLPVHPILQSVLAAIAAVEEIEFEQSTGIIHQSLFESQELEGILTALLTEFGSGVDIFILLTEANTVFVRHVRSTDVRTA
jgi:hypothetical protein